MAEDVRSALGGTDIPRRYRVVNAGNSYSRGTHWVAVVYEIKHVTDQNPQLSSSQAALSLVTDETGAGVRGSSSAGPSQQVSTMAAAAAAGHSPDYSAMAAFVVTALVIMMSGFMEVVKLTVTWAWFAVFNYEADLRATFCDHDAWRSSSWLHWTFLEAPRTYQNGALPGITAPCLLFLGSAIAITTAVASAALDFTPLNWAWLSSFEICGSEPITEFGLCCYL